MSRQSYRRIGWKSVRVRIAMADGAWCYVEEWAAANHLAVRDAIPILLGRAIEQSVDRGELFVVDTSSLDPDTPIIGPDGLVYEAQELPGLARPLEEAV